MVLFPRMFILLNWLELLDIMYEVLSSKVQVYKGVSDLETCMDYLVLPGKSC